MQKDKKCLAVSMGFDDHMLDHMAPLAASLNIPLLLTEENTHGIAKEFYPMVNLLFRDRTELLYEDLAKNYDAIFRSAFRCATDVQYFASLLNETVRLIYCPHGNSDKGHLEPSLFSYLKMQDGVLVYGEHMIERLKKQKHWERLPPYAMTGNYRALFYLEYRKFYQNLVKEKILSRLPTFHTLLFYAPTWNDLEGLSSFFEKTEKLADHLPKDAALIIKPHPLILERSPAHFYANLPKKNLDRIVLLEEFPSIYPLLDLADAYIGDFSSIGYDALFFEKPMFFFDPISHIKNPWTKQLHETGVLLEGSPESIYQTIDMHIKNWSAQKKLLQKKRYHFAFGDLVDKKTLREEVGKII